MSERIWLIIVLCAGLTYVTRSAGYLLISRLRSMPPRLAAALDAVPAAVIATLVAPAAFSGTWREAAALAVTLAVGFKTGPIVSVAVGTLTLIALRWLGPVP